MSSLDDRPPPPPPPPPGGPGPGGDPYGPAPAAPTPARPPAGRPTIAPPRRLGRRTPAPVSTSPGGLPTRRRWGRFAAGITLALLGAWVFAAVYVSAGKRVEVLALANDVSMYQELTREDLRTVRVAADPSVETVKASQADDLVGRIAAVELREGTLLAGTQLFADDVSPPAAGFTIVTGVVDRGQAGPSALVPGRQITVNVIPKQQSDPPVDQVDAELYSVGDEDENDGKRQIEFIVRNADNTTALGDAARDGRITLGVPGQD
ncbi:MAG TPA: SAF domain-containing protein [Acidimicrobiales bacterium]|nr:SAF domain-containing protein [Acidimicrobiales bacterium]